MNAVIRFKNNELLIKEPRTIENAILSDKRNPDAYLFLINKRPVPMTYVINDGDVIEALKVASGG